MTSVMDRISEMADSAKAGQIWSVIAILVFTVGGVSLVLFYRRLHFPPIQQRFPGLFMIANVALVVLMASQCILELTRSIHPISLAVFIQGRQLDLCKLADASTDALNSLARWARFARAIARPGIRAAFMAVSYACQFIPQLVYCFFHPVLFTATYKDIPYNNGSLSKGLVTIGLIKTMITICIYLLLAVRLRIAVDAFGIKTHLKRVGIGSLIGFVVYLTMAAPLDMLTGGATGATGLLMICLVAYVFTMSAIVPIVESFTTRVVSGDGDDINQKATLERFLRTPKGFNAFREHLVKEWAIENIMFYHDANEFLDSFPSAATDDVAIGAERIYQTYLAPSAPMEVNLCSSSMNELRAIFVYGNYPDCSRLRADMFLRASEEILNLMQSSSLGRFRETNPEIWKQFANDIEERNIIATLQGGAELAIVRTRLSSSNGSRKLV